MDFHLSEFDSKSCEESRFIMVELTQHYHQVTPYASGGTNHGLGDAYGEHYPEHPENVPSQVYYPDSGHPLISGHPDYARIKKKGEQVEDLGDQGGNSTGLIDSLVAQVFCMAFT